MRTVYLAGDDPNACPACSTPLVVTAHEVDVAPAQAVTGPLIPENEELRMAAVARYEILDSPPDGAFDRITSLAARIFGVPIATITVVDHDRIWFKSKHGIDAEQIDRDPGLCASAIIDYEPWVVNDASKDPRTLENPLVRGELGLRFYAGAPLTTAEGYNLGTLNIIDIKPRVLSNDELLTLTELAEVVVDELELRLAALKLARQVEEKGLSLTS
jgi:GAF domain-containing protein